jgi:tetratricopeptide (TPR) repeat protein
VRSGAWMYLAVLAAATAFARPVPLQDPLQSSGWQHFYNNEYDEAVRDFECELKASPQDPNAYNHLAQSILYRELFRNGALESELVTGNNPFLRRPKVNIAPEEKLRFRINVDKALALSRERLQSDDRDADALYAASVAHGLRANYSFLVEKAWTDALHDATASRKLSDRLLERDPGLTDAYLIQGLHDYVVGNLPFYMRFIGHLAGFRGDRERGLRELQEVAQHGVLNKYDARILLAVIYRRERRPADAIPLLQELSRSFPGNYLLRLEQVQMYSDAGDKFAALRVLNDVEQLRAQGTRGYKQLPPEKIKYLRGNLLFWYGDVNPALEDMKVVTAKADQLDLNTAVLAWLRLGQLYDLQGRRTEAVRAYEQTMKTAPDSAIATEAKSYIATPYKRKLNSAQKEIESAQRKVVLSESRNTSLSADFVPSER